MTTLLVKDLRDFSWGEVVNYAPLEGVTIPHPAHQFKCHPGTSFKSSCTKTCREYILFTPHKHLEKHDLVKRGPYPVYVGSQTREKMTGKLYQLPVVSRPLMAATRLQQIRGWTIHPKSRMNKTIDKMIRSRTNLPVDFLVSASSEIAGGSVTHRLDDHATKRNTLHNSRANYTTHIWFSCDTRDAFQEARIITMSTFKVQSILVILGFC
jgi:hypothetical protein